MGNESQPPVTVLDVVAWICIQNKHLLCARTRGNDVFYLPGGKRESGESDWTSTAREVKEELGVQLVDGTLTEVLIVEEKAHGFTEPTRVVMKCFQADYVGELKPCSEIAEIAWLRYAEKSKCAPATQRVLEHLAKQQLID
ncbi:MAG: NUDIX domain-containing protein [Cyanobacteria bacterium J06643_4]